MIESDLLYFSEPDVVKGVPYQRISRWARQVRADYKSSHGIIDEPEKFRSIKKLSKHLKEKYPDGEVEVVYGNETVKFKFQEVFSGKKNDRHLVFYNEELLLKFTEHEIFCDGTFHAFPKMKKVKQLFTVLGKIYGKVSIIFQCFLTKK